MKYYRNAYYDKNKSVIYVWDYDNNIIKSKWVPYLFIESEDGEYKTLYGKNAKKLTFDSYKKYSNCESRDGVHETHVIPTTQFLTEIYNDNDNIELPDLNICFIDIETPYDKGFPNVTDTPAPIVLIACVYNNKKTVFGIGEYDNEDENVSYVNCRSERDLLLRFFTWFDNNRFNVISGLNICRNNKTNQYGGFDLPYIIRRCDKVFNDAEPYKKLSPVRNVKCWCIDEKKHVYDVSIAGIAIIDYLALYKWFSFNNLEKYSLDYICKIELGNSKTDHSEYDTFYDFYKKDWSLFVKYCINDAELVYKLEEKLGYISLAHMLTSYCGCTLQSYNSSVALIDGLILKYLRNNGMCSPPLENRDQKWFPAAYVKKPIAGLYSDIVDLDIASSYPTHIIILNMSPETYIGRIIGYKKDDVSDFFKNKGIHEPLHEGRLIYGINVKNTRKGKYPPFFMLDKKGDVKFLNDEVLDNFNKGLKRKLYSIAPNGAIFNNKKKGVMAYIEKKTFEERVKQKSLKAEYKKKAKDDPENAEHWNEMSQNRHVLQWAIKILINSMFGVLGVPYCRYSNVNIAEAITSCGRHTIQMCEKFVDDLLNNPDEELINIINEIKGICDEKIDN